MGYFASDLDGTLADYSAGWQGPDHIGAPVPKMVDRIKRLLSKRQQVRIFTARVFPIGIEREYVSMTDGEYQKRMQEAYISRSAIHNWCLEHFGGVLPVQCWKDFHTIRIFDDRAAQVYENTGELVESRLKKAEAKLAQFGIVYEN